MNPTITRPTGTKISKYTIFITLCVSLSGFASELNGYEDFLRAARENNPGVQAAYNRWQAELSKADAVKTLPDPRITYGYFIESVETRTGPQEQKAGISQQLPWFGKLDARQKAQLARADRAYEAYRSARLEMEYDLRNVYARGWLLHREIDLTQQHIGLLEDIGRVAESRVRAGASTAEVIKTQLERAQLEEDLRTLEEKQVPIRVELNALMNRPHDTPVAPIRELEFRTLDTEANRSTEGNPELLALAHTQMEAEAELRSARKEGWPDFTLGVEWIGIGDAAGPVSDSGRDAWMAGVGITLPLWRGSYSAGIDHAALMRQASDLARQQKSNALQAELESALAAYREAGRKIALYRDTMLPQARQLLELNETDYRSGKSSFLDLIDTQRSILRFELQLARSRADSQIHLADIERLTGRSADE